MRSSSVAITRLVRYLACEARSQTCWSMLLPARGARTLPGSREDAYRAGMTPRIRCGTIDLIIMGPRCYLNFTFKQAGSCILERTELLRSIAGGVIRV